MTQSRNSHQAKELIHRARTRLLLNSPFYGFWAQRLRLRDVGDEMPTMATDSVHMFYNPDFVVGLSKTQLVAAIAHEVEHAYLNHVVRAMDIIGNPETDPSLAPQWQLAQIAMDMAINPHLKDSGFDLIEDAVYPSREHWSESFEQHYRRLKQTAKKQPQKCGGGCSGVKPLKGKDGKGISPAERQALEQNNQVTTMNAYSFAKAAGKVPGHIQRMIDDLRAPKVSWRDVLRRFMQNTAKQDYRMMPPNRRFIHQGLFMPSLRSEAIGPVLLILDGSGSTCTVFPQFISEFASIMLDTRPETLYAMAWDTRCTWMKEFPDFSDETEHSIAAMQGEMGAGGGTVFTECFEYFEQEVGIKPQVAVVLTDMELVGAWPEDPGYPVIWVATTDIVGPYGETVMIGED